MQAFSWGRASAKISVIVAAMLDLQNLRELGRGAGEGGLHCRLTLWLNNITEIFDNVWLVAPGQFKTCCGLCTLKAKNSIKKIEA